MLIMVANKKKLKRIIIGVVVALLSIGGIIFGVVKNHSTPTFNIIDEASLPYERGTKANSGYVAMTCNVDLGWEEEYIEGILNVLKKEDAKITFNVTGKWAENNKDFLE